MCCTCLPVCLCCSQSNTWVWEDMEDPILTLFTWCSNTWILCSKLCLSDLYKRERAFKWCLKTNTLLEYLKFVKDSKWAVILSLFNLYIWSQSYFRLSTSSFKAKLQVWKLERKHQMNGQMYMSNETYSLHSIEDSYTAFNQ